MESAVFSGSVAGALFLTTLAGAATVLGAASAFFTRRTNTKVLSVALGLSGGEERIFHVGLDGHDYRCVVREIKR